MTRECDHCGLLHQHALKMEINGHMFFFDRFECAVLRMAPQCRRCGTSIVGDGIEIDGLLFCGAACLDLHAP